MNRKDIEELATNAVRKSILTTGYLSPYISENDKGPSWDGFVYLYRTQEKTKRDYCGRVPVQVKGTEHEDLTKERITHTVEVVDLKSYACDGGVMFFVVRIAQNGNADRIYYAALTPAILRTLLDACAEGQENKNITLQAFPGTPEEKTGIFRSFNEQYRRPGPEEAKEKTAAANPPVMILPGGGTDGSALPSYWQGPEGFISEDRLLEQLAKKGIHILDLHYGNQIPRIVRRLREEHGCDVFTVGCQDLTGELVRAMGKYGRGSHRLIPQYFCNLGDTLVFRDLDFLAGKDTTMHVVSELMTALAADHSIILSGSLMEQFVPELLKFIRKKDYYQICR